MEQKSVKIQAFISHALAKQLQYYSKRHELPMSRLVAIALDNEIYDNEENIPFKWDYTLPKGEYAEYAFAEEAGRILTFMKNDEKGMSLDFLLTLRHDIGIKDKKVFLAAFNECLEKEMIEVFDMPETVKRVKFSSSVVYRLKSNNPKVTKKIRKKLSDRDKYERLKKRFEGK